ncbi:MAG TPA: FmdB family zinc ribbon protein [Acidimicrobiia bacterium]|nr:FmdB family zinc ribbon protein [Acidimicrobiia bacterium]
MPTYEYTCKGCGQTVEVFQSFSEKPLRKHADCGGKLQKVFHARGVVFKGSGFYTTDSRSSSSSRKTEKTEGSSKGETPAKKSEPSTKTGTSSAGASSSTSSTKSSD